MSTNLCYFSATIETTKDLCMVCRHKCGEYCYHDVCSMSRYECDCNDRKTYKYDIVIVSIPEETVTKMPTESVYSISIYTSDKCIDYWEIQSDNIVPNTTFSVYTSMDNELSMRSIPLEVG